MMVMVYPPEEDIEPNVHVVIHAPLYILEKTDLRSIENLRHAVFSLVEQELSIISGEQISVMVSVQPIQSSTSTAKRSENK